MFRVGSGLGEMRRQVLGWFYASVALPAPRVIRVSLNRVGLLPFVEKRLLDALFPKFCRSVTAVIEARRQTEDYRARRL